MSSLVAAIESGTLGKVPRSGGPGRKERTGCAQSSALMYITAAFMSAIISLLRAMSTARCRGGSDRNRAIHKSLFVLDAPKTPGRSATQYRVRDCRYTSEQTVNQPRARHSHYTTANCLRQQGLNSPFPVSPSGGEPGRADGRVGSPPTPPTRC